MLTVNGMELGKWFELIAAALMLLLGLSCIVNADVLRFNDRLKLPTQVSLIGFVKGALSDLCLT